jgi:hypothetical protein
MSPFLFGRVRVESSSCTLRNKMSQSNITVLVSRFERHLDLGSISVHFYVQHPTLDVGTSIPAILPIEGSDSDVAQRGWELVFPQALEWVRTTTAPVAGRQFVVSIPPEQDAVESSPTSVSEAVGVDPLQTSVSEAVGVDPLQTSVSEAVGVDPLQTSVSEQETAVDPLQSSVSETQTEAIDSNG